MFIPDLTGDTFGDTGGGIVLGSDLVLTWENAPDEETGGLLIQFTAREGDGTRLAVLGQVRELKLEGPVLAELVRGCSAMARKLFPGNARIEE